MPLERPGDRRMAGLSLAALLALAPGAARAAEPAAGQSNRPAQAKGDEVDAAMLRDLEVLNNPNYARDQEIAKRLSFYERMRMLDRWLSNRPAPEAAPVPAEPAKREVR